MGLDISDAQKLLLQRINFHPFEDPNPSLFPYNNELIKRKGIYYTPNEISAYICFQAISSYLLQYFPNGLADFSQTSMSSLNNFQQMLKIIEQITILDPACGAGAFLVQAAEILYQFQKWIRHRLDLPLATLAIKKHILRNNIFGIDLFEEAIEATKIRLYNWLHARETTPHIPSKMRNFPLNLYVGNSLIGWVRESFGALVTDDDYDISLKYITHLAGEASPDLQKLLHNGARTHKMVHWQKVFHPVIASGGFDVVVGNPPYIFIRGRNFSSFEREIYKRLYLRGYVSLTKGKARQSRKINSFALFLLRGIDLLKPNGCLGFIVPNTLLRTTTNDFIRQFITENTQILEIVDLQAGVFRGITASTILLFLQKSLPRALPTRINFNIRNLLSYDYDTHVIYQSRFKKNPVFVFNIHLDSKLANILSTMHEHSFPLGVLTKAIIEGIVCRKKDNLFSDTHDHPLAKKLLRGKNISRYRINWPPSQYILYATDTSLTPTKLHRPRPQWVHEAREKLLIQRIGGGQFPLKVALDDSQYYTFASINNIILKDPPLYANQKYHSKYILALLNSKLMNAYYLLNFSNMSSLTVNISKTYLETLPIKEASPSDQSIVSRLTDYLLFLHQYPQKAAALINFFDDWLMNSLIYSLYFPNLFAFPIFPVLLEHLPPFPPHLRPSKQFHFLFNLLLTFQQTPSLFQMLSTIKQHPFIQRIERLFHQRKNILKHSSHAF
ncbi:MAG: Eco57I restriction-modification methylase domain-containing protein [Candidatus Helarchaeota archaeon]